MSRELILILVVIGFVGYAATECHKCGGRSLVQCTDDRSFFFCDGSIAQTTGGKCPEGTVCADIEKVCGPKAETEAECPNHCNECHPTRGYACITKTQYAFCDAANKVTNMTGTCKDTTVCSVTAPGTNRRCAASPVPPSCLRSTPLPTEPPVTPPTPTLNPPFVPSLPTQFCEQIGTVGHFPVPGSQCRKYIYCSVVGNMLFGIEYTCPLSQLFNPLPQICVCLLKVSSSVYNDKSIS